MKTACLLPGDDIHTLKAEKISYPNLITNFPAIYPLLSRCKAYIGDCSSIGYDFLAFNRPKFLLEKSPLSSFGRLLQQDQLYDYLDEPQTELADKRNKLYNETFRGSWKEASAYLQAPQHI